MSLQYVQICNVCVWCCSMYKYVANAVNKLTSFAYNYLTTPFNNCQKPYSWVMRARGQGGRWGKGRGCDTKKTAHQRQTPSARVDDIGDYDDDDNDDDNAITMRNYTIYMYIISLKLEQASTRMRDCGQQRRQCVATPLMSTSAV